LAGLGCSGSALVLGIAAELALVQKPFPFHPTCSNINMLFFIMFPSPDCLKKQSFLFMRCCAYFNNYLPF